MLETGPVNATIAGDAEPRCNRIRESMLLTWVLYGVVRATQALAGEQPPNTDSAPGAGAKNSQDTQAGTSLFSPSVSPQPLADAEAYSPTEFRPRRSGFGQLDSARTPGPIIDTPMLQGTSVWEQLAEYRSQNRVRLLTLWQTRGSSLSLQAGKRGAPSLQWSTPWVHHEGGASRGLFDRLLPNPRTGSSNSRGTLPRPTVITAPPKSKSLD
jgi:hypothetical protein